MFNIANLTPIVNTLGARASVKAKACAPRDITVAGKAICIPERPLLFLGSVQLASSRMKEPGISEPTNELTCPVPEAAASNYHLPQVWADYLNSFNPWSWYGHLTFRGYPHPETAIKTFDLWTHKLNRRLFGCRYYKHPEKGITWARGTELQRRGSVHFHFIAGRIPDDVNRFDWMDEWYELGGISRIYPYEVSRGAEYYLSKSTYAWKRGEVDLGGPLPQLTLDL